MESIKWSKRSTPGKVPVGNFVPNVRSISGQDAVTELILDFLCFNHENYPLIPTISTRKGSICPVWNFMPNVQPILGQGAVTKVIPGVFGWLQKYTYDYLCARNRYQGRWQVISFHGICGMQLLVPALVTCFWSTNHIAWLKRFHFESYCYKNTEYRADSQFAPNQWDVTNYAASHWLGANLESALK